MLQGKIEPVTPKSLAWPWTTRLSGRLPLQFIRNIELKTGYLTVTSKFFKSQFLTMQAEWKGSAGKQMHHTFNKCGWGFSRFAVGGAKLKWSANIVKTWRCGCVRVYARDSMSNVLARIGIKINNYEGRRVESDKDAKQERVNSKLHMQNLTWEAVVRLYSYKLFTLPEEVSHSWYQVLQAHHATLKWESGSMGVMRRNGGCFLLLHEMDQVVQVLTLVHCFVHHHHCAGV